MLRIDYGREVTFKKLNVLSLNFKVFHHINNGN